MYKVLIADDELIIRNGLCKLVDWNSMGFEIIGLASNGQEALNYIQNYDPDIVLIDIKMPKLHGLEAIRHARENGFTGAVIILSGYSDFTYAQEAIDLGVTTYLTKPVDEKLLLQNLVKLKETLDAKQAHLDTHTLYFEKARSTILEDFLLECEKPNQTLADSLGFNQDSYQVVIYEKYSHKIDAPFYSFTDLLKNDASISDMCEFIIADSKNIIMLKGSAAINRMNTILTKYSLELPPEKNSPLDTVFISCGRIVEDYGDLPISYADALHLINNRFFCDEHQHIVKSDDCSFLPDAPSKLSSKDILDKYCDDLINHIQSFNKSRIADTLKNLQNDLYTSSLSIESEKKLLVDLYVYIKEKIFFLYKATDIPFISNSDAISYILNCYYLYEIIAFLSTQFDMIMQSIGYSSKDSIIDNIFTYIDHNYAENITLENIAPLFGYNSSYLGKIFSKKAGINFNSYLDNIRIERSKELLLKDKTPIYKIAELVGYRNVDYFHIKFKKNTGISPAAYRREHTNTQ